MSNDTTSAPFNWREHLPVHPAASMFRPLSETDPKALHDLAEDIRKNGLQSQIVIADIALVDDSREGMLPLNTGEYKRLLLDGQNRLDALALLGWLSEPVGRKGLDALPKIVNHSEAHNASSASILLRKGSTYYRFVNAMDGDEESNRELYDLVLSLNVHRRHLTAEQKRDLIAKILKRQPDTSDRHIGETVKADHKTVAAVRSEMVERGEIPHVETRTDSKGREQPSVKGIERQIRTSDTTSSIAKFRANVSLEEWKALRAEERQTLLAITRNDVKNLPSFNRQTNDAVEWAQWTWNPVTGFQHNCSYCYARDIANQAKMSAAYPHGFEPAFRPAHLLAPRHASVPAGADKDTRLPNVFTVSMGDLFGRWVPAEWIEAVLTEMRNAPQWNFLCLTKFPKRMSEFDIPENAWMGTSVDLQARVTNAENAFSRVKCGVRWLSIEPMIEPLKFKTLEQFDWIVIGGASRSSQTPEWRPPFEWIADLVAQARAAGTKVYFKTNLGIDKRILELTFDAPIPQQNGPAPDVFRYLGKPQAPHLAEAA
jgi:protein gp37